MYEVKEGVIINNQEFSSTIELYNHLKPALNAKKNALSKMGYSYIKIEDIWNCLKIKKWSRSNNLKLYEMVDDILNTSSDFFEEFVKEQYNKQKKEIDLDKESIL